MELIGSTHNKQWPDSVNIQLNGFCGCFAHQKILKQQQNTIFIRHSLTWVINYLFDYFLDE